MSGADTLVGTLLAGGVNVCFSNSGSTSRKVYRFPPLGSHLWIGFGKALKEGFASEGPTLIEIPL
jgi:hypothetical protein